MTSRKNPTAPRFPEDEAYRALRSGDLVRYHQVIAGRSQVDFSNSDLRGADLRGVLLEKVVLRGSYLRDADLRGLDLRAHDLEGCSLSHAKVSGTYFPDNLSAEELRLSLEFGTRLRHRDK